MPKINSILSVETPPATAFQKKFSLHLLVFILKKFVIKIILFIIILVEFHFIFTLNILIYGIVK